VDAIGRNLDFSVRPGEAWRRLLRYGGCGVENKSVLQSAAYNMERFVEDKDNKGAEFKLGGGALMSGVSLGGSRN